MSDYDMSIHTNPDAMAWVAFFRQTHPNCNVPDDVMLGWFANSMMAMHDWLGPKMDAEIERLRKALEQMADINALSIVKTFDRGRWVEEIKSQWGGRCTWATIDQIPEAAAYLRERDSRPPSGGVQNGDVK
jgi:hypothetical protein